MAVYISLPQKRRLCALIAVILLIYSVFLSNRINEQKNYSGEYILLQSDKTVANLIPLETLSYNNLKLPVSSFSSVEFLTLEEIDARLDKDDPRRTPFIKDAIAFFLPDKQLRQECILPNTHKNRTLLAKNRIPYSTEGYVRSNSPSASIISYYGPLIMFLILALWAVKRNQTTIFLLMQWLWLLTTPSAGLVLSGTSLIVMYLQIILYGEKSGTVISRKNWQYIIFFLAVMVYILAGKVFSSAYVRFFYFMQLLYVPIAGCLQEWLTEYRRKRWMHPQFRPVTIIDKARKVIALKQGLQLAGAAGLALCVLAMPNQATSGYHLSTAKTPAHITLNEYFSNAAFQSGYLYNAPYKEPANGDDIRMVSYNSDDLHVKTEPVIIKQFTDEWYSDIIAQTQPLLLKFCNDDIQNAPQDFLYETKDVIIMMLPITVIFILRFFLGRIFSKSKGFSCILMNS